jgi:Ca2+ transporting ATPase
MRKYRSTVIRRPDSTVRMYTKGAPDILLKNCKTILNRNGEKIPFSTDDYDRLAQTVIEPMRSIDLRTICLAYKDFSSSSLPDWNDETSIVDQLTCICIFGIGDPVRPEVPCAIAMCQNAGITVRLITGDNINTARSIALKCGIISGDENDSVLEGEQFNRRIRSKTHGEVDKVLKKIYIFVFNCRLNKIHLIKFGQIYVY